MRAPWERAPDSALASVGYRALMLAAAARLRREPGRGTEALRRALRDTAVGRRPRSEREWTGRIDSYRGRLPADAIAAVPGPAGRSHDARLAEARDAVRWMSVPPVLGRLLTRIVAELRPRSCLELGTGFGVSTAYQAAALAPAGGPRLTSLDTEAMAELARPGLEALGLTERVALVGGRIEDTVAGVVAGAGPIDYALLDADHTERGTLEAFAAILPGLEPGAIVCVDDINWTEEMSRAWAAIVADERVGAAVDVRRLGFAVIAAGDE